MAESDIDHTRKVDLEKNMYPPGLEELEELLRHELIAYFKNIYPPYNMTCPGISTKLRVAELGGIGNLFPKIRKDKIYNLNAVVDIAMINKPFVFGPAGGPRNSVGTNCELVVDANFYEGNVRNRVGRIVDGLPVQQITVDPCFGLMGNLAICDGRYTRQPILKIAVSGRKTEHSFPESLRRALKAHFGGKHVILAGIWQQKNGRAKIHIMPDFPENDFSSLEEEKAWLKHFEMDAPLIGTTVLNSIDPAIDVRLEHTHCFREDGECGHYITDTNPDDAEFEGVFVPASHLYRIDRVPHPGQGPVPKSAGKKRTKRPPKKDDDDNKSTEKPSEPTSTTPSAPLV